MAFVKKSLLGIGVFLGMVTLLIGCMEDKSSRKSSSENNQITNHNSDHPENEFFIPTEEVTLTFMMWGDWGQGFENSIKNVIEEAFPFITIENVGGDTGNREWIEESLAAGIVPDIIFAHRQYHVALLEEYQLGFDMTNLLDKHNFDLTRFELEHLEEWRSWTQGEIWLLPFMRDVYALHYNKDIFDMFGVEYPTDGMTWQEVIDLAAKVTGERNGIQYQGLEIGGGGHLAMTQVIGRDQLIDPETDQVLWVDRPFVKQYLEILDRVYNLPGNEMPPENPWTETRTLAMRTLWLDMHTPEDLNFDIVTFPVWEEAENIGPMFGGWAFGITEPSENKDIAMHVLKFLYSDENIGRLGESPIHAPFNHLFMNDDNLDHMLEGERLERFKGKNLAALYKMKPAGGPGFRSKHDVGAFTQIEWLNGEFLNTDLDVNSFLRELKEKEEIRILNEKGM